MEFYQDVEAQESALETLGGLIESGVPLDWIIARVEEVRTESLCWQVLTEAGLLSLQEQPVEA